ncbi:MAG: hypothetical protein HDQ98_00090 [Lachnospiraceae bacterium]|nr:hypothetical protein [Lachnospiraceae bacterium]
MRLFVRILGLFDSIMKAMFGNEFLCLFLGMCLFAIALGVFLKIRYAAA